MDAGYLFRLHRLQERQVRPDPGPREDYRNLQGAADADQGDGRESTGFEVLHGIVDCLWVIGEPISDFKEAVERETGILTEFDSYDCITFLPMAMAQEPTTAILAG